MYNVSKLYREVINQPERLFKISIRVEHENGTLYLDDKHLALGSFNVIDSSQAGEEFTIGGTVAKHIEFTLVNSKEFEDIKFMGAKVIPTISLLVVDGVDAHYLQPSQPSEMLGYDDVWEHIPMGQFNIDVVDRLRNTIEIKAMDNMILLDKPYTLSGLNYPASLANILRDVCSVAGVGTPNMDFPNSSYIVNNRPIGDHSLRNIVGYVAELAGSFAKFDRTGRLHMNWYNGVDKVITKHQRSEFELGDFEAQITGIRFESKKEDDVEGDAPVYIVGEDDYAIDLSGNELLQSDYATVLPNILANIGGVKFTPYMAKWNGDPALDVGDIVTHVDLDGVEHYVVVTNTNYKYMGASEMSGKASPNITRGFKSSDNRIAAIIGRVEEEFASEMNNLQQEQLRATELIGNMLGGHVSHITEKDELIYQEYGSGIFIHDAPKLQDSTKIWKWGIGGFGFSDDGGDTYMTGVTIDGSIVANIISANHINTGTLSSNEGNSWISMDTGEFELGGMKLIDNEFSLTLQDLNLDGQNLSDRLTIINSNIEGISASVSEIEDDYITTSQLNVKAGSIESTVKSYTDTKVGDSETSIMQTVSSISASVDAISNDYITSATVTVLNDSINSKVSSTSFTGYNMASLISQSSSAVDLIASNITLSADNIDLDGITRVNSDLSIGGAYVDGVLRLAYGSKITGYGSGSPRIIVSTANLRLQGTNTVTLQGGTLDLTGVDKITGNNIVKPYYPGTSNACYIDYDSSGGRLAIRNSRGSHVGYVKLT